MLQELVRWGELLTVNILLTFNLSIDLKKSSNPVVEGGEKCACRDTRVKFIQNKKPNMIIHSTKIASMRWASRSCLCKLRSFCVFPRRRNDHQVRIMYRPCSVFISRSLCDSAAVVGARGSVNILLCQRHHRVWLLYKTCQYRVEGGWTLCWAQYRYP